MGIWEQMPDTFLDKLGAEFGFDPPREHGWSTVDSIRAMRDGKVDVFFALGGNFAAATPDTAVDRGRAGDVQAHRRTWPPSSTDLTSATGRRRCCCPAWAGPSATTRRPASSS